VVENLLNELNEAQRQAVQYTGGPQLVIAGAGSGKTRVLTYKVAYLISKGINPNRILSLTFTNKASKEMKSRIDKLLGYEASRHFWMGTFHSIFGRMLRIDAEILGFTKNFTIYDSADSLNLVKSIIKELNLNDEYYKPKSMLSRISASKNNLMTAEAYAQNNDILIEDAKENREHFHTIYTQYSQRCRKSNVMDFDDMLLYTNILFKVNPPTLEKYRKMFDYILVDEYQDTNFSQYLIIKKLSEHHRRLCVVGDDAQSIYSFRGAKIQNILNFKNDYEDYQLFKLEQNYRSTKTIVNAANSLIEKNSRQIPKKVFSENDEGTQIHVEKSMTDGLEGIAVAGIISQLCLSEHYKYSDFAILYRTNSQSRIMEEALRKYNINYKVYGGLSFYQRKEIKDIIAYIRLSINHNDIEAFRRIINYPSRKIGNTSVDKILQFSANSGIPVWDIVSHPNDYNVEINAGTKMKIAGFAQLIQYFTDKADFVDAYEYITELVNKAGINHELFLDKTPEGVSRYENIQELINGVKDFCETRKKEVVFTGTSVTDYLENISILTDLENADDEESKEKVSMMTIHSAKGLEFKNVIIVGVEENLFPNALTASSINELEEERRLFYVAMTRAMENLFICYCVNRFRFGSMTGMEPSRFIKEINPTYLDWPALFISSAPDFANERRKYSDYNSSSTVTPTRKPLPETKPYSPVHRQKLVSMDKIKSDTVESVSHSVSEYVAKMKIRHKSFGAGEIIEITGIGDDSKAIIKFDSGETKTLLLKYAKLDIL
jgi:DNA helicase-2/ATP-dependent DNA helicase PcrA